VKKDAIRIYVAGPWEARSRLRAAYDAIEAVPDLTCTSTWLTNAVDPVGVGEGEEAKDPHALKCANMDLDNVMQSDVLILDTLETNNRGGKDFESGVGFSLGLEWWVVGPYRNVFQRLAHKHFKTWDEAIAALPELIDGVGFEVSPG